MNTQELKSIYGNAVLIKDFMFREDQSTTPLYLVVDFFKTGLVPIYMYIIDLKEQRHDKFLNERSYKQIFTRQELI